MSEHRADISWNRKSELFTDLNYSRDHSWVFDGGQAIPASASPSVVPSPFSTAANVDPEEAFIASISSCHMLFFLSIAAKRGYVVNSYKDAAVGILSNKDGKYSITHVNLNPVVVFEGENQPDRNVLSAIHKESHKNCFIANSVNSEIDILF